MLKYRSVTRQWRILQIPVTDCFSFISVSSRIIAKSNIIIYKIAVNYWAYSISHLGKKIKKTIVHIGDQCYIESQFLHLNKVWIKNCYPGERVFRFNWGAFCLNISFYQFYFFASLAISLRSLRETGTRVSRKPACR